MSSQHITLAYHLENQKFAQQLEKCFAKTNAQYEHLVCREGRFTPTFNETLKKESNPILLLLSDNYLKSRAAMSTALSTFTELINQKKLTVLLIDGINENGKMIPTEFDRIGQLIKYMNYWQDKYLELRQRGRKLGEIDDTLELETKEVREISTNIGELLRYLRDQSIAKIEPIIGDDFKSFNEFYKISGAVETSFLTSYVKNHVAPQPASSPSEKKEAVVPPIVETKIPEEPAIEEAVKPQAKADDAPNFSEELEIPPVELSAIPGMSMLNEKAKLQQSTEEEIEFKVESKTATNEASNNNKKIETKEVKNTEQEIIDENSQSEVKNKFSIPVYLDDFKIKKEEIVESPSIDESILLIEKYIHEGSIKQAKTELDILSEKHERDARIWNNLGVIAEQENDYILASTHYSRALELDPTLPFLDYKVGLINSNYYPDQMDKSLQYFEKAIAKDSSHVDAYYQMGIIQNEGKGLTKQSIPTFKKVLELAPNHEFANYDLALIYYNNGDKESALDYYVRAFTNNPELQTPENDLAFGYMQDDPVEESTIQEKAPIEVPKVQRPSIDKTVLITGATSGIGKATAIAFAEAGYRIVLTGRRSDRLKVFSKELQVINPNVQYLSFDVRDIQASGEALNTLTTPFSEIDILINNAGLASGFDPIHTGNLSDWDKMIDTNIKGILFMVRLISPTMVERKAGHIINICSTAGHEVYPKGNVYCATKHAVDALTKGMRLDLHSHGIRVSQVSPAHVEETEFAEVRFHGDKEKAKIYEDFNPLKSSDVAQSILFIASQPPHVNIQDILLMGTQQASSAVVDRTGRKYD